MNKQELIKKYEMKGEQLKEFPVVAIGDVLKNLRELDEPEKVIIPKFVADWIEESRKTCKDVADFLNFDFTNEEVGKWFMQERPFDLVARAWLDGYEVEKEKKYKVVMPNVSSSGGVLTRIKHDDSWIWIDTLGTIVEGRTHTHKELEDADFGWVFDCPGIKIEEVEE